MTPEKIAALQGNLGLSDNRMASALGVTRQTFRNWRRGCKCPQLAQNAMRWMIELRRLSPTNDNLPDRIRFNPTPEISQLADAQAVQILR